MNTSYTVTLLASYHKKEYKFECNDYKEALDKFKEQVIDSADFLSVLGHGSVSICIIDCDNLTVRAFNSSAIKPD